ncbi:MAG TPA: endolytic transglycosylase MltG [Gemmatimonadales bacterium]|nr:endolytic transglycosylase MltG [Gemmatimonadales bacterium]
MIHLVHRGTLPAFLMALAACQATPGGPVERVVIPRGATFRQATDSLAAHGLIRWRPWFLLAARVGQFDRAIRPGVYEFVPGTPALGILRDLRAGRMVVVRMTVPEGRTLTDIAAIAEERLAIPADSVVAASRDTALLRHYGIPGTSAEGYLAPETYLVPADATAGELVRLLLDQFQAGWEAGWTARLDSIPLDRHQVVILASIVEGEAQVDEERPVIAGVYLNRLRIGMALQADPTVQYAIQLATGTRKPRLVNADYAFPSPYNTYLNPGLPPGPVGSPGRKSIEAVLYPASVPYLYFVASGGGRHAFSRTYDEHLRHVARARAGR